VEIVAVSQNVGRGALRDNRGRFEDRWPVIAAALNPLKPDIVLVQEAEGWDADGAWQLVRAEGDLGGLDGILAPRASGLDPALLYRRERLGRRTYQDSAHAEREMHHGLCVVAWDLRALPAPLAAASLHLTPYDAGKAISEANFAASRLYKLGPYVIVGGDVNFEAARGPEPDTTQMRPYNRGSRLLPSSSGKPQLADRGPAQKLADNGLVDVAWYLYQQRGDEGLLAATAGGGRIDQMWVSAALAPCIVDYGLIHHGASDHPAVWVRLDLAQARTDDVWTYV
jgi:endonuclease/exonuclease/phosphatase family metal-dependent hydrolase